MQIPVPDPLIIDGPAVVCRVTNAGARMNAGREGAEVRSADVCFQVDENVHMAEIPRSVYAELGFDARFRGARIEYRGRSAALNVIATDGPPRLGRIPLELMDLVVAPTTRISGIRTPLDESTSTGG
jgi:hypothetical protein